MMIKLMDNEVVHEIKCFGQANISEYKLLEINAIIWRKKKLESYVKILKTLKYTLVLDLYIVQLSEGKKICHMPYKVRFDATDTWNCYDKIC